MFAYSFLYAVVFKVREKFTKRYCQKNRIDDIKWTADFTDKRIVDFKDQYEFFCWCQDKEYFPEKDLRFYKVLKLLQR